MSKMNQLIYVFSIISMIAYINCANQLYQVIWYEKYEMKSAVNTHDDHHVVGMKFVSHDPLSTTPHPFSFVALPPTDYSYITLHKKSDILNDPVKKIYYQNLASNEFLSFYFPNMDGSHVKDYVVYGITIDCFGYIRYKIKFFNCSTEADNYYTALGAVKKIKYTTGGGLIANFIGTNCALATGITTDANLITAFTSSSITLELANQNTCPVDKTICKD